MSKPTEQRYPSGPVRVGEQKSGSPRQPFYKAKEVIHDPVPAPANEAGKPPLRAARGDDDLMSQEPKKS
ncbi:hypothetical protein [Aquipseudomonas ullengensis]|uniref:Uncharacterized protein n=1 Tax=Aquipseudomonas ullengensis TaxID=2759166 RepID=A0A7W4LQT1_9GAMM|nr:hypothetical protein [Pseudomonas ullengensis]MBB2497495.1 hypothetical protein [Pseudomonas ullengensis]